MELAIIRRYLRAIDALTKHPSTDVRKFAWEMIDSIIEFPAFEILGPIHSRDFSQLTPNEKLLRTMAGYGRIR